MSLRSRTDRGAVTAETALASIALAMLAALMVSVLMAVGVQVRCTDAASAIARQAARGDTAAIDQLKQRLPQGATAVTVSDATTITVTVTAPVRVWHGSLGQLQVSATATAVKEPGA
ncbi:MAG: TadE family type IV pilus minor pilin [Actinomycetia bacterium]|nr:TadE family type IV pilus minor pilin [Actinomycetes bacterium]